MGNRSTASTSDGAALGRMLSAWLRFLYSSR